MVLGKLPVPGRPTNLDKSRAGAYCACGRCGWGLFGHFSLIYHFSCPSPSLWETARYRLEYCLKGPLSPKQPTNQLYICSSSCCYIFFYVRPTSPPPPPMAHPPPLENMTSCILLIFPDENQQYVFSVGFFYEVQRIYYIVVLRPSYSHFF